MTDDDSDPTKAELEQRVNRLEATVERLLDALHANRREVLSAGASGIAAFVAGQQLAGDVEAADTSAGAVGASGASQDIYLDEILDPTGDQVADLDDSGLFVFQRGLDLPEANIDTLNNNEPVVAQSTEYEIQKDGTDGAGTINFKTA
jgi:hypothetical protein